MKYLYVLIINAIILFIPNTNILGESKETHLRRIFDNIIYYVNDGNSRPEFMFLYNKTKIKSNCSRSNGAWICPSEGRIYFEEWLYDLIYNKYKDSADNVFSFFIGHEIAHFYKHIKDKNTNLLERHGIAYSKSLNDHSGGSTMLEFEKEADIIGSMYSYLAGYDTRKIRNSFMKDVYSELSKRDNLSIEEFDKELQRDVGYFSLAEREKTNRYVIDSLSNLIHYFEIGNHLFRIGSFEDAAKCYEHILYFFPSKDIFNNLGICYAELAIRDNPEISQYKFPFSFETESIMSGIVAKGVSEYSSKAKECFRNAIARDSLYWTAYINLSCVYIIEDSIELANEILSKIENRLIDKNLYSDMCIAKGIAFALTGYKTEAERQFNTAKTGNSIYAEMNINAIQGNHKTQMNTAKESPNLLNELVCGYHLNSENYPKGKEWSISGFRFYKKVGFEEQVNESICFEKDGCSISYLNFNDKEYNILSDNKNNMQYYDYIKIKSIFNKKILDTLLKMNNYLVQSKDFYYYCYYYKVGIFKRGIIIKVNRSNNYIISWTIFQQKKKN